MTDSLRVFSGGVKIAVKAKPCSRRSREIRQVEIGDGKTAIEVSVAAAAHDGKANAALMERLSEWLGVPKSSISISLGTSSRLKSVEIHGDAAALERLIDNLLRT